MQSYRTSAPSRSAGFSFGLGTVVLRDYFHPQVFGANGDRKIPQLRRIKMEENNAETFWANLQTKDAEEIKKALEQNPEGPVEKW